MWNKEHHPTSILPTLPPPPLPASPSPEMHEDRLIY